MASKTTAKDVAAEAKVETKTVIAVASLVFGHATVPRGKAYAFPAAEADDLVARGHAVWPSEEASAPGLVPPKDQAGRVRAIVNAIASLDPDEGYTAKGLPSLAALARVLGWEPSLADRAEAVEQIGDGAALADLLSSK